MKHCLKRLFKDLIWPISHKVVNCFSKFDKGIREFYQRHASGVTVAGVVAACIFFATLFLLQISGPYSSMINSLFASHFAASCIVFALPIAIISTCIVSLMAAVVLMPVIIAFAIMVSAAVVFDNYGKRVGYNG